MPAGNASNTVFTAIPVGEDFTMSFPTDRFYRNIAVQDFVSLTFKLYDARVIGSVSSPNPNALITQYNNQDYNAGTNPEGRPTSFYTLPTAVNVLVGSSELDAYEATKTNGQVLVFRGELYGYVEAVVTGEETKYVRFVSDIIKSRCSISASLSLPMSDNGWWDNYFFPEDVRKLACKMTVSATLGVTGGN